MTHWKRLFRLTPVAGLLALGATGAAHAADSATARMMAPDGAPMGTVTLVQTPAGVLINAQLSKLSPGGHGFHIHENGNCSPDFKAAGGHYNPTKKAHGIANPQGRHAGDMPNIFAAADGTANAEILNPGVSLTAGKTTVFDANGSAIIIHAKPDSHAADPGAGGRVACGVIEK